MEDKALDNAHFLRLLGKLQNTARRVVIVVLWPTPGHDVLAVAPEVRLVLVLVKSSDAHRTDSNRNNAHGHARQGIHHRTAKIVRRRKIFERMEHRRNSRHPLARLE